ncbi:MAG: hypothetical protein IPJ40_13225 [Saprospirales bacterium]|nr:hypothetical protein [Saprospirales bacterium]
MLPAKKVTFSLTCPEQLVDATIAVVKKGAGGGRSPIHQKDPPEEVFYRDSIPGWLPDIRDVSLSGMLVDSASGRPIKDELVYVSILDKTQQQLHLYRTGENGAFIFPLHHLSGQQKVFISSKPNDAVKHRILVHSDFSTQYARFPGFENSPDTSQRTLLEEMYINHQLQKRYTSVEIDSSGFPIKIPSIFGEPAISVTLSDYIDLPTMEDVFTEIIPFVSVRKRKNHFQLWVLNQEETAYDQEPLVLIDNLPVFDLDALMQIDPALVYQIEVVNSPYILGSYQVGSIVLIKTSTGDFAGMKFPESTVFLDYKTQDVPLEFPMMNYDAPGSNASRLPDFRTVLYWNPRSIIDSSTNEIHFYTSDHESEYSILIRGFDREGNFYLREEGFLVRGK